MRSRQVALIALLALTAVPAHGQGRVIEFPDVPGYGTYVVDLHIHSVFSDGSVWPDIRVQEAVRDGLDLLAVTEHLEYQPHLADIPHPDRNRSFEISERAVGQSDLIVVNGAEITRSMPPGHSNAIFINDANALLTDAARDYLAGRSERLTNDDVQEAFVAANDQGAFIFWNHPSWTGHRENGVAVLAPIHRRLIQDGLLHGIEVANGQIYSAEALQFALDFNLTVLGVSDIHGLIDWDYDLAGGAQRTSTLVFAEARTADSIHEALRAGRTVAWMENTLIGRAEHLAPLLAASLQVSAVAWRASSRLLEVTLSNSSSARFDLRPAAVHNVYDRPGLIHVPPHGSVTIALAGEGRASFDLEFEVLNAITAPNAHPLISVLVEAPGNQ
ncbi:MAG: PHP domain-containing protein [Acidobacteria bacterium]|nr:PHP domain-containing protein [Acidobacteriota bacterium]